MLTNGDAPAVRMLDGTLGAAGGPPESGDTALTFCFCTSTAAGEPGRYAQPGRAG
jgi:hypothetical protein